jgi:1-aminocyclopropane-1-carboxylate deaminase
MIEKHLNIPSPMHKVSVDWAEASGVELWIKRDDLIHPIISGNKWRKLSGILNANDANEIDTITTYGGAFSNHLVATACTASILGKKSKAIVRGERPKNLNGVLKLCEFYGMELHFVKRSTYRNINRRNGLENGELFVPEGGASTGGTVGCEEILREMDLNGVSKVYVACGTGTTLAGMLKVKSQNAIDSKIIGVQVLKGENYIKNELKNIFGIENSEVLDTYHSGGYAKTNNELIYFIKSFTKQTGIVLDPIYTGKLMMAVKDQIDKGVIKRAEKVVAVHTGGLTGWFGKADLL